MKEDVLPEGWVKINIQKAFSQVSTTGKKVPTKDILPFGKYPVIDQGEEFISGYFNNKDKVISTNSGIVIFGDHTRNFKLVNFDFIPGGDGIKILKPNVGIDLEFFYFQCLYLELPDKGYHRHFKYFKESNFYLPPLPEQQYLSQKLTALLDEVVQTKQRLEAIPALLKQFRQSVLADAVSGRLTEEWRENNELSLSDWIQSNVGNIAKVETGKTPSRKNQEYWENGYIPWLTSSCTGLPYVNFADEFVTDLAVKECGLKIFNKNTLLLAMYGEGKTRGQVTELKLSATCNQACAAITANNNLINNQYLKLSLLKNYDEIRKSASGGNQPNLNLTKVREIKIHLPSLKEQTQIVQKVETYFALADEIETQVNAALENVNLLTQSILAKAFSGELSATWRNSQVRETQGKV